MSKMQTALSKEIHDVLTARWEGFKVLAKKLPNRHILAVELVRTLDDETIAVFTVVQNGEPVHYLVRGDAHGKVKSNIERCLTPENLTSTQMSARSLTDAGEADPAGVAMGDPPPHQPTRPGIVAIGGGLLGAAFDIGELVDTSAK